MHARTLGTGITGARNSALPALVSCTERGVNKLPDRMPLGELVGEHAHHDEITVAAGKEHAIAEAPLLDRQYLPQESCGASKHSGAFEEPCWGIAAGCCLDVAGEPCFTLFRFAAWR
ncbi:hypothetical protein OG342_03260 [Streptomyces bobili]|uniref:hypothetical protein n=1 Tax=Streptomyces bobili TaxID=67280 RepID=UPI0022590F93|nr:hypothetical protein [Streptomyces bobili]MCX5521890.1 hypothetical protein [Streptomyces bobili]